MDLHSLGSLRFTVEERVDLHTRGTRGFAQ